MGRLHLDRLQGSGGTPTASRGVFLSLAQTASDLSIRRQSLHTSQTGLASLSRNWPFLLLDVEFDEFGSLQVHSRWSVPLGSGQTLTPNLQLKA